MLLLFCLKTIIVRKCMFRGTLGTFIQVKNKATPYIGFGVDPKNIWHHSNCVVSHTYRMDRHFFIYLHSHFTDFLQSSYICENPALKAILFYYCCASYHHTNTNMPSFYCISSIISEKLWAQCLLTCHQIDHSIIYNKIIN